MRLMIANYGDGAFGTLRCTFDLKEHPPEVQANAVSMPAPYHGGRRQSISGWVLHGITSKTTGEDNEMSLTIHHLSAPDAIKLAQSLLDYASYLVEAE